MAGNVFERRTVRSHDDDDVDGGLGVNRKGSLSFMVSLICPHILKLTVPRDISRLHLQNRKRLRDPADVASLT